MKEGKFLFEATVNIERKCVLSDLNGGLAEHWTEEWDVAVLNKSNYNPCEIWCVTHPAMISDVKILSPSELLMDDNENKHKENHPKYEIFFQNLALIPNENQCILRIYNITFLYRYPSANAFLMVARKPR